MLSQMSADMWQAPPPEEEAAVAEARLRAKEAAERARAHQDRLEEEAEQRVRELAAARARTEAAKVAAERAVAKVRDGWAIARTEQERQRLLDMIEDVNAASQKDAEAAALHQRSLDEAKRLRATAEEEAAAKRQLEDLEEELDSAEDHQWTEHREKGCAGVGWSALGVVCW